jgi:hypothetical protein
MEAISLLYFNYASNIITFLDFIQKTENRTFRELTPLPSSGKNVHSVGTDGMG